jgi:hypothetical protein
VTSKNATARESNEHDRRLTIGVERTRFDDRYTLRTPVSSVRSGSYGAYYSHERRVWTAIDFDALLAVGPRADGTLGLGRVRIPDLGEDIG